MRKLTLNEARERLGLEQFLATYPPILGAQDPPDPEPKPDPEPEPAAQPEETETIAKTELNALRRRLAEAEKDKRKAADAAKAAEEAKLAEEGKWKELADQRQRELDNANAKATKLERQQRVASIAMRLKFRDVEDVLYRPQVQNATDDTLEGVLEDLARARPDLVSDTQAPPQIGRVLDPSIAPAGSGDTTPLTVEQIKNMTAEQIADRYDEVQKVLAAQPVG